MNTKQVTLGELVLYVLNNRKGNAFLNYPEHAIAGNILKASNDGTMLYAVNDNGEICGVVVGFNDVPNNLMYVNDILTTERWVLPKFIRQFKNMFPNHKLVGSSIGTGYLFYNTERLVKHFLAKEGK